MGVKCILKSTNIHVEGGIQTCNLVDGLVYTTNEFGVPAYYYLISNVCRDINNSLNYMLKHDKSVNSLKA